MHTRRILAGVCTRIPVPPGMRLRRIRRVLDSAFAAALVLALGLLATSAGAQSVVGVVRASAGAPLPGATVLAADSTGTLVAGATTGDDGRFALALRTPGTYRLTVRRIGFAPSSAVLQLRADERLSHDATLQPFAVRLTDIVVADAKRCTVSPSSGAAAVRLWEETQSALAATVAGEATPHTFTLERFERELDPGTGSVRRETRWRVLSATSEPYHSVSADSLAVHGFVVAVGDSLVYYAPDARTLISDAFARGHCFHPVRDSAHPDLVGLAFAPAPSARGARMDVTGTLWLDAETAELRRLEFSFTPTQRVHIEVEGSQSATATGDVSYRRAPDSTWIVGRWMIHMPVVAYRTVLAPEGGISLTEGALVSRHYVASVRSVIETGGSVVDVTRDAAPHPRVSSYGAVSGRFADTSSAPGSRRQNLSGIGVALEAAGQLWRTTRTDSTGAFRIDSVVPGTYLLRASGGVLDTLGVAFPGRRLDVRAAGEVAFVATLPSRAVALAHLCGASMLKETGAIHGTVRDAGSGAPIAGATVRATWFDISDASMQHFSARTSERIATSDSAGSYALCQLPLTSTLALSARRGTTIGPVTMVPASSERLRLIPLVIGVARVPQ